MVYKNELYLFQQQQNHGIILGHVDFDMFCEMIFLCEIFAAMVALKMPLPSVRPHVALQITRRNAIEVALVTLMWLFSCVLPHHVKINFIG